MREFGSLPFAALRAAVPTGGRRSLACGPCLLVGIAPRGACYAGVRGSSLSQRCRAAMPVGDRRSIVARASGGLAVRGYTGRAFR